MHWPKISEKKKLELEQVRMSLHADTSRKKSPVSYADTRNGYGSVQNSDSYIGRQHNRATSD